MISCPHPAQTNIPQRLSCLEQARNTITTSFHTTFSLVSTHNRTTGSLEVTAQSSVPSAEPARGTLPRQKNIPTTAPGSWEQSLSSVRG